VCIQRWEAQLIDAAGRTHDPYAVPPLPSALGGYVARSVPGVVPQGHVGREQAEIVCAATTDGSFRYRLCTAAEWEAACRGPRGDFPRFQSELVRICNTGKFPETEHLVYRFYPEPRWTYGELNDRRINQVEGGLARTGAHPRCRSGYGVFDLVGNLQEWVADLEPRGQQRMSVIKGDHYMGQGKNLEGCAATNRAHFYLDPSDPGYRIYKDWKDYSTGFRCCADPQ
jgi:sulfatase modifying factor 1